MIWFTSDEHYGHANIISYCKRPFRNVTEMEDHLVEQHNSVVRPGDLVIHLGDFSFLPEGEQKRVLSRLAGDHEIVKGNHDRSAACLARIGFDAVSDGYELEIPSAGADPMRVLLSHYPYWRDELAEFDLKYRKRMPKDTGLWLLHGHIHNFWPTIQPELRQINVGVDCWKFRPVSINVIMETIARHV
jgi:calcineurin-like phosphoesterase family protein